MMNQIGAGVCIIGSTDKIADANRAACRMLGRPRRELRGKRIEDILTEKEGVWVGERPDGMPLAIERIPGTIESERGPLRILTLLDVTARHLTAECLQHLANHDPLTGLPNRGYLEGRFKQELTRCRKDGVILGVAALDLDDAVRIAADERHAQKRWHRQCGLYGAQPLEHVGAGLLATPHTIVAVQLLEVAF